MKINDSCSLKAVSLLSLLRAVGKVCIFLVWTLKVMVFLPGG